VSLLTTQRWGEWEGKVVHIGEERRNWIKRLKGLKGLKRLKDPIANTLIPEIELPRLSSRGKR